MLHQMCISDKGKGRPRSDHEGSEG